MVYLLFFCLLVGLILSYYLTGKNLLSAWVLSHIMFLISVSVVIINIDYFATDISFITVVVILMSLFFFGVGEISVRLLLFPKSKIKYPNLESLNEIIVSKKKIVLSSLVILFVLFYNYNKFIEIGSQMGGQNFITSYALVRTYAVSIENGEPLIQGISSNHLMDFLNIFVKVLVYMYMYIFLYNLIFFRKRKLIYFLPVLLYIPIMILGTTRSTFIQFIAFIAIIAFIMYKQKHYGWQSSKSNTNIAKYGSIFLLVFMVIFMALGTMKREKGEAYTMDSAVEFTSGYIGASIIGLDKYLNTEPLRHSDFPGQRTLDGVVSIVRKLGFNLPTAQYHQVDFTWKNGHSNIYASPYYLILDFSYLGLVISRFFWGFVLGYVIARFKYGYNNVHNGAVYVISSLLYYPIFMIAISEEFGNFIGAAFLYEIVFILFCQKMLIGKNDKVSQ